MNVNDQGSSRISRICIQNIAILYIILKKSQIKQQLYHNYYKVRPKPPQHAIVVLDRTRKCHKVAVRIIGACRERQLIFHAHGCKTFKSGSGYLLM